jgi:hypothetical protein
VRVYHEPDGVFPARQRARGGLAAEASLLDAGQAGTLER